MRQLRRLYIFNLVHDELCIRPMPWENIVSFATDNANVKPGMKRGVAGFIAQKHLNNFIVGCTCHLIHLAASSGGAKLQDNINATVEGGLIKIYYYFDKSSNRKRRVEELQFGSALKPHKMLKLISTRWLGLAQCVDLLLE